MHEGGCECGQVRYVMDAPIFVNCCHCRQCQRSSGSAFAINAMIESDRVHVTAGVPERVGASERCPNCHIELWAYHRKFGPGLRFVRVGTLDRGETLPVSAHFFTATRHRWITPPEGIPAFAGLPREDEALWPPEAQARVAAAIAGQ